MQEITGLNKVNLVEEFPPKPEVKSWNIKSLGKMIIRIF